MLSRCSTREGALSWNAKTTADVRGGLRASPRGHLGRRPPGVLDGGRMSRAHSTPRRTPAMLRAPGPVPPSPAELSSTSASYPKAGVGEGQRAHHHVPCRGSPIYATVSIAITSEG